MGRLSRLLVLAVGLVVAMVVANTLIAGSTTAQAALPTAIVSLGDSSVSGEGAGDYVPPTDSAINRCHRSANALVHQTHISGIDKTINLACSGAQATNLRIGATGQYDERNQLDQLDDVAHNNSVRMIIVQVGANDDPAFGDSLAECIRVYLNPFARDCWRSLDPVWPSRVSAMADKVALSLADIRAIMRNADYSDDSYELVLQSYASPLTEHMHPITHGVAGCPVRIDDAAWGRTSAVVQMSEALRGAAERAGARFLDLSRATEGHEACNELGNEEWQRRLVVDLQQFREQGVDRISVQQSFHPSKPGHAQLGRCLGEFAALAEREGACLIGVDGNLHAGPRTANPAAA